MRFLNILPVLLLATTTTANPVISDKPLVINKDVLIDKFIKYTAQHDIVNILVPLNKINFEDDDNDDDEKITIFFVQADVNDKGVRDYKGLYLLKDGVAKEVLANGHDAAAFNDDSKVAYFGASDGIYLYNGTSGTTEKYGTIADSIVQIAADNKTGIIYFLTEDHEVYSLADEGTKKNKVEALKDVQEFTVDYASNIYYYDSAKQLNVFNQDGVKKFEITPIPSEINLVRPMFARSKGVYAIIDRTVYFLNPNGTAEKSQVTLEVKLTAYAPEATLIQFFAWNKKIYECNSLEIINGSENEALKKYLDDVKDDIKTIATKSRSSFGV